MRYLIIALALVGCAARIVVEPTPRKEIVAKVENLRVKYQDDKYEPYVVDRWWLVAADGTACSVGLPMWKATYVGQVLACPYAWRRAAGVTNE